MPVKESTWVEAICPYRGEPTGWIVGVVEYAGCGSHEAEWSSEENKRIALAAPDLLEALDVIAKASERSETMFGGKMSDVTRVFQNISRVSRAAIARARGEQDGGGE